MLFSSLLLFGLAIPAVLADQHGRVHHARHHELAQRDPGEMEMFKRFSNSRWSFYDAGLGACGKVNSGADYIVALNAAQFGNGYPGPNCFKFIRMTWKGVSVRAQIVDRCPGCPFGGLDLTRGLFSRFADLGKGIIDDGQWTFEGAEPPKPPPTPKPSPTTRTTQRPTSTRTRTPTSTRTSTRTTRTSSSTSTSESESASSTSSSATTPAPTDGVVSGGDADAPGNGPQFLAESNQAILGAGQFLAAVVFSAGKQ